MGVALWRAEFDHRRAQQDGTSDHARGRQPGVHHARARERAARRGALFPSSIQSFVQHHF